MPWDWLDIEAVKAINGLHAPWLDVVMKLASHKAISIILAVFLLFRFFAKGLFTGKLLVIFVFSVLGGEWICSQLIKPLFNRPRPCVFLTDLYLIENCGKHASMPSSHSYSAFCIAFFSFLCLGLRSKTTILLFCAALMVGISRIYLAQHFLTDVLVGGILGFIFPYILIKTNNPI